MFFFSHPPNSLINGPTPPWHEARSTKGEDFNGVDWPEHIPLGSPNRDGLREYGVDIRSRSQDEKKQDEFIFIWHDCDDTEHFPSPSMILRRPTQEIHRWGGGGGVETLMVRGVFFIRTSPYVSVNGLDFAAWPSIGGAKFCRQNAPSAWIWSVGSTYKFITYDRSMHPSPLGADLHDRPTGSLPFSFRTINRPTPAHCNTPCKPLTWEAAPSGLSMDDRLTLLKPQHPHTPLSLCF
ncbi:hypothetical protein L249_4569 [Ophiocordyceps polyrhachis-furcata BCC 54312]|uniref:Uncharacterized protein n=1 Tax=Ophiocordyceps polyrhachis-furcata BCC 54312 TaxID=1330021 RepID=A0A367KZ83_9HYPO|nr:hypothetical protein L249_4569 [Ophiocordyceps polyrhachis-furcata BCC 54312]